MTGNPTTRSQDITRPVSSTGPTKHKEENRTDWSRACREIY